jgi:hypothetical protein
MGLLSLFIITTSSNFLFEYLTCNANNMSTRDCILHPFLKENVLGLSSTEDPAFTFDSETIRHRPFNP